MNILDSVGQQTDFEEHLIIIGNIREKNKTLSAGDKAPEFCLYDKDSVMICLEKLKGNYIYLGFCNSMNYSCIRQYGILENLHSRFNKYFKIVIITNSGSFEQMRRFVRRTDYPWTFLYLEENQELLERYRVTTVPAYYFIDRDGNFALIPAPQPSENIEQRIFEVMREDGALK
jgi:peroxiredoxin